MAKRRQEWQTTEANNKTKRLKVNFLVKHIGDISTYENNEVEYDVSQMKILSIDDKYLTDKNIGKRVWSNLNMNLNENYEDFTGYYNETKTAFHKLLDWISSQEGNFEKLFKKVLSKEDSLTSSKNYFVCTREVLVFIFSSKYKEKTEDLNPERKKDFLICATKFQGVIYLSKAPQKKNTDKAKEKEKNESDDGLKKIIYYGHKFEHNITRSKQDPDSKLPNLDKQYYAVMNAVMNAQFDVYHLIFSAQMDAVDDSESFVEIKTNFKLSSSRIINKFRWKLLSFYLQSFIAGVPRLICGFRNDEGTVNTVREYPVSDLPGIAAKLNTEENIWSPDECLKYAANFLSRVKECVDKDDPKTVYTFSLMPAENDIKCKKVGNPFLPKSYINKMPSSTV